MKAAAGVSKPAACIASAVIMISKLPIAYISALVKAPGIVTVVKRAPVEAPGATIVLK